MLGSYGSQSFRLNTPFITQGQYAGIAGLGQSVLPESHRHWSNYSAFVYDTKVKYGDDRFSNQVKFLNERLNFVKAKMYVQLNRLGQIENQAVRDALRVKYDLVNEEIDASEYPIRNVASADQLKGRFNMLNDVWSAYDRLVNAIQVLPGTVGLSVQPEQLREQALSAMTEEERNLFEAEGGSQYMTQLSNEMYQGKVIDVIAEHLGEEAVAPMREVHDQNTEVLKNSKPGIVETLSDNIPAFEKILDVAEGETFGSFFSKFFGTPALIGGAIAAIVGGAFLAFKLGGTRRRPVTANPCGRKRKR